MDMKRLQELANNPDHIIGIYNYCNRWCEKCSFTSRCLLFAQEKEDMDSSIQDEHDVNNEKFWKKIHDNFQLTLDMIGKEAERMGIDLEAHSEDQESLQQEKDYFEAASRHPITIEAKDYMLKVKVWFDNNPNRFNLKWKEFEQQIRINPENDNPEQEAQIIHDAIDVVKWYFMQISVKISRAFNSRFMEEEENAYLDMGDIPGDADGSAKVALIGMDDSMGAWAILLKHLPEEEESILGFLMRLEKLRKSVEKEFPKARKFHRAGFDDYAY
jgi:hypothetical protein